MHVDRRTKARRMQLGAFLEFKVPMRGVEVVRLLWRVEGAVNLRGVVLDARLASPRESARSNTVLAALYGGFVALCLTLLVSNFALWGALRHRFQLHYCAMLVALIINAVSASGALTMIFPEIDGNDALRISYVSLGATGITALSFARTFFERRVFAGWLGWLVNGVTGWIALASMLFAAFEPVRPVLLDRLFSLSFVALIALIPAILWRAHVVRSRFLGIFCLTWGVPILLGTMRVAHTLGLVGWSFLLDNSTLLAMTAEALLSSLAIAYRVHLLSRERDRAREDETAARLLAATDPLTGLLNRRAFLAQAIGRTGRQTLLILDLDHFKQVNETIGHDGGDEVLRLVASFLQKATPAGALVARIGGEEFAIVVDARVEIDPAQLLFDLRTRRMPFDIEVTASIGVSAGPLAREVDWKALYRAADQALFDAKASGRDRVRRALIAVV